MALVISKGKNLRYLFSEKLKSEFWIQVPIEFCPAPMSLTDIAMAGPQNFIRWRRFRNRHVCRGNREAITNRSCLARGFRPHLGQRTNLGNLFIPLESSLSLSSSLGNFDVKGARVNGFSRNVWIGLWTCGNFHTSSRYTRYTKCVRCFKYLVEEYGLSLFVETLFSS